MQAILKWFYAGITDDTELNSRTVRFLSLLFLAIACGLSLRPYRYEPTWESAGESAHSRVIGAWNLVVPADWRLGWNTSMKPEFTNTLIALGLIAPLYLRRLFKWNRSIYTLVSFVLILWLVASLLMLAQGGTDWQLYGILSVASAVVLSWMGLRAIAGIAWLAVIGAALTTAVMNSAAMGLWGFAYIASGTLGLLLHSGVNPGELLLAFKEEYMPGARKAVTAVKGDLAETGTLVKALGETATHAALPGTAGSLLKQ